MIGTEAEAREWWCPMARVAFVGGSAANRQFNSEDTQRAAVAGMSGAANCIAGKCAAWRWTGGRIVANTVDGSRHFRKTDGFTEAERDMFYESPLAGYCGLAGKPMDVK